MTLAGPRSSRCRGNDRYPDTTRSARPTAPVHLLRRRGQILHRRHEDQTVQAHCHTLVVNACILSTTWYLHDVVAADRAAGYEIGDATIAYLTPARFEAINPYGLLTFEVAKILNRTNRRPLRTL
jgi:hypothetical protein